MNDSDQLEFAEKYETALETAPVEVREFLWSDAYKGLIAGIAKTCNLSDAQKEVISDVLFDLVINMCDEVEAKERFTAAGISEEGQTTIFSLGYDYIVSLSAVITAEALVSDNDEADTPTNPAQIVAPGSSSKQVTPAAFAAMQQRLQSPSITTGPVQGDYTAPAPAAVAAPEKPAIDPYHEAIDNE